MKGEVWNKFMQFDWKRKQTEMKVADFLLQTRGEERRGKVVENPETMKT